MIVAIRTSLPWVEVLCPCPENEAVTTGNSGLVSHVNLVRRQSGYGSHFTACSIAHQLLCQKRNGAWTCQLKGGNGYPIRRTASRIDWWYIIFTHPPPVQLPILLLFALFLYCPAALLVCCVCVSILLFFSLFFGASQYSLPWWSRCLFICIASSGTFFHNTIQIFFFFFLLEARD